jgi:hypothetical protein
VTTDEALTIIAQPNKTLTSQNEMLISLTARLVWTPEKLVEMVMANKKKDPEAYVSVYNALDGRENWKTVGRNSWGEPAGNLECPFGLARRWHRSELGDGIATKIPTFDETSRETKSQGKTRITTGHPCRTAGCGTGDRDN